MTLTYRLNKNCCPDCNQTDPCNCADVVEPPRQYDCSCPSPFRDVYDLPENPDDLLPHSDNLPCCPVSVDTGSTIKLELWYERTGTIYNKVRLGDVISQYANTVTTNSRGEPVEYDEDQEMVLWKTQEWTGFTPYLVRNQYTGETKTFTRTFEPCCYSGEPYNCTTLDYYQESPTYGEEISRERQGKLDRWDSHNPNLVRYYSTSPCINEDCSPVGEYAGWSSPCIDSKRSTSGRERFEDRFVDDGVISGQTNWEELPHRGQFETNFSGTDWTMLANRQIGGTQFPSNSLEGTLTPCDCGTESRTVGGVYFARNGFISYKSASIFYGWTKT